MFRTSLSFSLLPAMFCAGPCLIAQTPDLSPDLVALADAKFSKHYLEHLPGAAVLLMKNGRVIFQKGYGLATGRNLTPIRPDNAFHIGFLTEQFTAAATLKLVEDGKIDLQAPISRYLDALPEAWKAVTVEQLLAHTSGLPDYLEVLACRVRKNEPCDPATLVNDYVRTLPLDFEPGTQYRFSNTGYILLGQIIEKVSGQGYPAFLQQRLLTPLGMKHTHDNLEPDPALATTLGTNFWGVFQQDSAWGLVSTAEDLARWTQALHEGKVLKPASLARMLAPVRLSNGSQEDCGLGLEFHESLGRHLVGSGGPIFGYNCRLEADPANGTIAVVLSNTTESKADVGFLTRYLLSLASGRPIPPPVAFPTPPSHLQRFEGRYQASDGKSIVISMKDGQLFENVTWERKSALIPLSATEFGQEDSDTRWRFEVVGARVTGLHRRVADSPEGPVLPRMETIQDHDPQVTALVRRILREAIDGTLKPELFTPAMARLYFPNVGQHLGGFIRSLGQFKELDLYERKELADGRRFLYLLAFENIRLTLELTVAKDDRISEFYYKME